MANLYLHREPKVVQFHPVLSVFARQHCFHSENKIRHKFNIEITAAIMWCVLEDLS